jgi:hypothetical protein
MGDFCSVLYYGIFKDMHWLFKILILVMFSLVSACGGGGSSGSSDSPGDTSPPVESVYQSQSPHLGVGIFALQHPSYDVDTALNLLRASKDPVIAFIPGVFGSDLTNYHTIINTLLSEGVAPHVHIYALCGPCRQPRRDGSLVQFRPDLNMYQLEDAIRWDPEVRSQYIDYLVNVLQPIIDSYPQLNYTVVPELEDNQNDDSFAAMLDLTGMVFDGYANIRYVRNSNNSNFVRTFGSRTVAIEIHHSSIYALGRLQSGDVLSFDGAHFRFRDESKDRCGGRIENDPSFDETRQLVTEAMARGVSLHLWRHEWQGLPTCPGHPVSDPSVRNYVFTHVDELIELLSIK